MIRALLYCPLTFCIECCWGGGAIHGHGISQIMAIKEMFHWLGQDRVSIWMRGRGGRVLYWHKCLGLMNKFVKDEEAGEMPAKEYIKLKDPFMHLKTGSWGPTMDLSVGK